MEMFSFKQVLIVYGVVLLSSVLQGFGGFGFGMLAMSLLPFVLSVRTASVLIALLALFNTGALAWQQRRSVAWRPVGMLLSGSLLGVPLGVWFLDTWPEGPLKRLIGVAVLLYCGYAAWREHRGAIPAREWSTLWCFPIGLTAGILGGAVNTGGPPVIFYIHSQPWKPEQMRATLVVYFFAVTIIKDALLFAQNMVPWEMIVFAGTLPLIGIGGRLGLLLGRRTPPLLFRRIVLVILCGMGLLLLKG
ncbi:MAG: hypothetical protein KatS3mg115_1408 [Candidatus Poribacteria bacterium]|nr:MAG: hypothetical protein KatS3mg115_1408 [Candidatus Poribacteria bacterium]